MNPDHVQEALADLRKHPPTYKKNITQGYLPVILDASMAIANIVFAAQRRNGVQLQVSKQVSDDLINTEFSESADMEDIPFIAPSIEFYFEDPILPTMLIHKSHSNELVPQRIELILEYPGPRIFTILEGKAKDPTKSSFLTTHLTPDIYKDFLQTGNLMTMDLAEPVNEIETKVQALMLSLCMKVLVFASIPRYKPTPITAKQMHWGGKPWVRGRPERPASKVIYLPHTITEHQAEAHKKSASKAFRGRLGHIHWYRDECFVNRQGTWDFFPPIVDPVTGKFPIRKHYKVRQPAKASEP